RRPHHRARRPPMRQPLHARAVRDSVAAEGAPVKLASLAGCLLALTALPARAANLDLSPPAQTVALGSQASVDVTLSGSGSLLGGFDLDVSYDPTLLSLSNVVFSGALGDPGLAEAQLESSSVAPGSVNLFGLSFLTEAELGALQGSAVPIATLVFETLAA